MRKCVIALSMTLAACSSSPKANFYVLAAIAPEAPVTPAGPVARLEAVHIPTVLERRQIVITMGATTVSIREQDRWAAPLQDLVRNALTRDLAMRMGVQVLDLPGGDRAQRLVVEFTDLTLASGGDVHIAGAWAAVSANPHDVLRRPFDLSTHRAGGGTLDQQIHGLSALVAELSDQIASHLVK
jgi:uncharacterized lipoprotein YmbA